MCFSSPSPPPTPTYHYESFKSGTTSAKAEGPANDEEARKQREGGNAAQPTVGDGLGRTGGSMRPDTIRVGAQERRNRTGGTTLGY
jgi:hypothetical protein